MFALEHVQLFVTASAGVAPAFLDVTLFVAGASVQVRATGGRGWLRCNHIRGRHKPLLTESAMHRVRMVILATWIHRLLVNRVSKIDCRSKISTGAGACYIERIAAINCGRYAWNRNHVKGEGCALKSNIKSCAVKCDCEISSAFRCIRIGPAKPAHVITKGIKTKIIHHDACLRWAGSKKRIGKTRKVEIELSREQLAGTNGLQGGTNILRLTAR